MTKEKFAELKTANTQFLTAFNKMYIYFYDDFKEEKIKVVRETPVGKYLWKISLAISEINQNFGDISFIREMLLACDPKNKPLRKKPNTAQAIRYHYENYILRVPKIKDHCLSLINEVMQLQVHSRTNMENQIIKKLDPAYGEFSIVWAHMKQITDYIKPYRNHLAHNGTVQHKDISLLDLHYTYDISHKPLDIQFMVAAGMKDIQRDLVQKFSRQIEIHLINADQVLKYIYLYLAKPFFDNMDTLTK